MDRTHSDLIARLEAATEGSREMDLEITKVVFPDLTFRIEPAQPALLMPARVMAANARGDETHVRIHEYTTSIDAALTLVPDGVWWAIRQIGHSDGHNPAFAAHITHASRGYDYGGGVSPALALCIAALKARLP